MGTICHHRNVLMCIQLRPTHEKASPTWLFQYLRRFCPSGVACLLLFRRTQCSWCTHRRKNQEQLNPGFRNCRFSRWLFLLTPTVSLNCLDQRRMFTRDSFLLNSFLNSCRTFTNDFVSTNHKTGYDVSFSVNIINSVQRCQRQSLRRRGRDLERKLGGHTWRVKKLFDWWNPVLPFSLFYTTRVLYYRRWTSYHFMKTV
jgi:hypothetical protein